MAECEADSSCFQVCVPLRRRRRDAGVPKQGCYALTLGTKQTRVPGCIESCLPPRAGSGQWAKAFTLEPATGAGVVQRVDELGLNLSFQLQPGSPLVAAEGHDICPGSSWKLVS